MRLSLAVCLFFAALEAGAVEIDLSRVGEKRLSWYGQLEYYGAAGSKEGFRDGLAPQMTGYSAWQSATLSVRNSGAAGLRLGGRYRIDTWNLLLGGNIGYLMGPSVTAKIKAQDPGLGNESQKDVGEAQYLRVLADVRKEFEVSDRWSLFAGAGLGVARARIKIEENGVDDPEGPFSSSGKGSRTGLVWEFSPGVILHTERADYRLGLRWASLPSVGADAYPGAAEEYEIEWRPFGLFLEVVF